MAVVNEVNDAAQLLPAMDRVEQRLGQKPQQVVADGDFTNHRSVQGMAERPLDFYGSWKQHGKGSKEKWAAPAFRCAQFRYEAEQDRYVCPAGQALVQIRQQAQPNGTTRLLYRAPSKVCQACPHCAECCPPGAQRGRLLSRKQEAAAVTAFQNKMATAAALAIYRTRSQTAEFLHAWLQCKLGLARLHVRGLQKAGQEVLWAVLTFNLAAYFRLSKTRPATA